MTVRSQGTRRKPVHHPDQQQAAVEGAQVGVEPPAGIKLRAKDKPFWKAIVQTRIANDWAGLDLAHAATLARTLCDIEMLSKQLEGEGLLIVLDDEHVINPKHRLLEDLTKRAMSLTKLLHLHAMPGARLRDEGGRKQTAIRAAAIANATEATAKGKQVKGGATFGMEDDLLARPRLQ